MEVVSKYHASQEDMRQEQEQVELARRDVEHFRPLYNKYYERIFLFVWQRVDDEESAHDVTSQVFLKALTNLHKYQFRGVPFASWLYRIAQSEVYNAYRKLKVQPTVQMDSAGIKDMQDEMEEDVLGPYLPILSESISELPEDDISLIQMRFFEKRAFKEIAEILDITENNAKVKTYRILEKLKKILIANKKKHA
jgi:RNA polymerase sigma-70 factor (ECF subfamily)